MNKINTRAYIEYIRHYLWLDIKYTIQNLRSSYPILTNTQTAKLLFDGMHSPEALPGGRVPKWEIQPLHIKNIFRKKASVRKTNCSITTRHPSGFTQIIRGDGTVHSYIPFTTGHWKKNV